MAKVLSYDEFIEYAKKYYERGGDGYVECWDKREFDEYTAQFGAITKSKALKMFRESYDIERDRAGWY